jgi:hypothetical protein
MITLVSKVPLVPMGDNDFLALDVGVPSFEVGTQVTLVESTTRIVREGLSIQAIDVFLANDLPEGFLELVGAPNHARFFRDLQAYMGTGLPEDVQIVAYLIGNEVVSEGGLFVDEAADDRLLITGITSEEAPAPKAKKRD